MKTKQCQSKINPHYACGEIKPVDQFYRDNRNSDGYRNLCIECEKKRNKSWKEEHKEEIKVQQKEYMKTYNKEYYEENKEELKAYQKEYNKNNPEKVSQRKKIYYEEHKEEKKIYDKQYYEDNKEEISIKQAEYYEENKGIIIPKVYERKKKRLANDPIFKFRETFSNLFRKIIKGIRKDASCFDILGYSLEELVRHMENQFEPWMTWENNGLYRTEIWDNDNPATWTWQIDHIIPHSTFQYQSFDDPDFKECWKLENLRPYSAKQNLIDGATRVRHNK